MLFTFNKNIELYVTANWKVLFFDWIRSISFNNRCKVKERLDRIALGNLGDHKYLCGSIYEFRLHFGPGYRIYYGNNKSNSILLLCGGDKSTQTGDIKKSVNYLNDYLKRGDL